MKVKTILVSQPRPKLENSPFLELKKRRKVKIDFIPFIHVKGATVKEIRLQKIDLTKFSAIILELSLTFCDLFQYIIGFGILKKSFTLSRVILF